MTTTVVEPCYVCETRVLNGHDHHVVMQADGGSDGPTVRVCGSCHQVVHAAVLRVVANRSCETNLSHLDGPQRERARILVAVAVAAKHGAGPNQHPLLSVELDDPAYMHALDRWGRDRGFTSRDAAVNALLRGMAVAYGLASEKTPSGSPKTVRLSAIREG